MKMQSVFKTIVIFILLILTVIGFSIFSNQLWKGGSEKVKATVDLIIKDDMTLIEFSQANGIKENILAEILKLKSAGSINDKLTDYGTTEKIKAVVLKELALKAEHASKNWIQILLKFILWILFLTVIFNIFKNKKISLNIRRYSLFAAVVIFGIVMGSDPSPMGTVKDAVYLFGSSGAVFPPRMIALTVFLIMVFIANKYICSWGCQIGTLQDLIYHINRDNSNKASIGKQIKIPFIITNGIRIIVFILFIAAALFWKADIIKPVDPFNIYKPLQIGLTGVIFIGLILILSLFIYRPWCHFFCPFGLVGWIVEKISINKISVDYKTCIACRKCASACPSTVMSAVLMQDRKTIPDCFSCYTCRDICPTGSIKFSTRKRTIPPADHFKKNIK